MNQERAAILAVGVLNAAAAFMAASNLVPDVWRLTAGAVAASCAFVLTQLRSWDDAAPVQPHG